MPIELSICIPTLNRARYIDQLLRSIEVLVSTKDVGFQVIVSDNCSDDDTPLVLDRWINKVTWLTKVMPSKRTDHAEDNVAFLIPYAQGEYIWLLGDDDDLVPSSIERLLNEVKRKEADLLVFNSRSHDFHGRPLNYLRVPCNSELLDLSMRDFVTRTGFWFVLSGFSTTILRRNLASVSALEAILTKSRIYSVVTWLVQEFWSKRVRFVNLPLVSYRQNLSDIVANDDDLSDLHQERARLEVATSDGARTIASAEPHWERVARIEKTFLKGIWTNKYLEQLELLCSATGEPKEFISQVVDRSLTTRFVFSYEVLKHFTDQVDLWSNEGTKYAVKLEEFSYFIDWSTHLFPDNQAVPVFLRLLRDAFFSGDQQAIKRYARNLRSVLNSLIQRSWYKRYHVRDYAGYLIYNHGGLWVAAHTTRADLADQQFVYLDPSPVTPFFLVANSETDLVSLIEEKRGLVEQSQTIEALRTQSITEIVGALNGLNALVADQRRSSPALGDGDEYRSIRSSLEEVRRERDAIINSRTWKASTTLRKLLTTFKRI